MFSRSPVSNKISEGDNLRSLNYQLYKHTKVDVKGNVCLGKLLFPSASYLET